MTAVQAKRIGSVSITLRNGESNMDIETQIIPSLKEVLMHSPLPCPILPRPMAPPMYSPFGTRYNNPTRSPRSTQRAKDKQWIALWPFFGTELDTIRHTFANACAEHGASLIGCSGSDAFRFAPCVDTTESSLSWFKDCAGDSRDPLRPSWSCPVSPELEPTKPSP